MILQKWQDIIIIIIRYRSMPMPYKQDEVSISYSNKGHAPWSP